jgi:hypothetical protein
VNPRKLLDWRKLLIYSHRWMGIVGGLLVIAWFISGIVFMYRTMPTFSNKERLSRLALIDFSTARIEPADAAHKAGIKPNRLRIGMNYDGRPVYRFQGNTTVYADTGEVVSGRDREQALALVRQFEPDHASSVRYDSLREDIDLWTAGNRGQMPLHKISVGDSDDTYYYISQETGEPVMKTDRASRFWGFLGPVLHQWYFTSLRNRPGLWDQLILWSTAAGSLMCLSGLVVGVWRFSPSGRFRPKRQTAHSPYSGWMWWHHYAGLLFGFVSLTWIFSGGLAFDSFGIGSSTNPTAQQRDAALGGQADFEQVTLEDLRTAINVVVSSFTPKEADVLQFRGELYLAAADGPADPPTIGLTEGRDDTGNRSTNFTERRLVWLKNPGRGSFTRFDDSVMMDIAHDAMPGVAIKEAVWLKDYDNYYRSRESGQTLPVLRVQYDDPQQTWLYLDPHRGRVAWREESPSRLRRWLYNGLHKFDFPYLYSRPLWDISMVLLSIGGLVLSATTLMPAYRRLRRHANRLMGWHQPKRAQQSTIPSREF